MEILVESKEPLKYLVYTLTSHGNIQKHEIVNFATNQNSYKINLMCTNEMVPHSFLYVHYMQGDNLIFCETKIELPRELENKVSFIWRYFIKLYFRVHKTFANTLFHFPVYLKALRLIVIPYSYQTFVLLNTYFKFLKNSWSN